MIAVILLIFHAKDSFANYKEATAAPSEKQHTMSDELLATYVSNANYDGTVYNNDSDEMPVTGAKNNVKLADLRGLDYEDPKWDDLLDELTYDEMAKYDRIWWLAYSGNQIYR